MMNRRYPDERIGTDAEVENDPTVIAFLRFIDRDIEEHPERLRSIPDDLMRQIMEVIEGVEVEPDEPIEGPVVL